MNRTTISNRLFEFILSDKAKERIERVILIISIASFFIHLLIILLLDYNLIHLEKSSALFESPVAAIYTPFSFILVYEVYLLIYYLPKSISTYISKQYEIITLIIFRRLFKDLSNLKLSSNWFEIKDDLQFTFDLLAALILFYLIYMFYVQSKKRYSVDTAITATTNKFIRLKKIVAVCLVPVLFALAARAFYNWATGAIMPEADNAVSFKNINNIFFDEFFTILIIVDVVLLLFSFFYTDMFHKVIRNSGFIISTILIRISFSVEGITNTVLIVSAVTFGLLILIIHNLHEKNQYNKPMLQE